ncbi:MULTISPECIES: NADP-dependent malic enzyme [Variovorax]|jgi:malate dehydrogenase (oxaloacetate-decarboxylating)(NADP+)|uniref:Malate dehydrogenase (Oxaloacetate-decarboxylating)(NADP+) n=1 Tax=Variovorax paradoxus TaxID=34073 RepID=A0AAW8ELC7_VARPD|nr:NADP-dependent malic enzyme [Variovorax paradoxus]MDP9973790.1 malate dehydrogenase (oxaloacetate-decarboxylating)(NADP+) [Variovorax paradoxus]
MSDDKLREAALDYHRYPTPGKISVNPTKPMATQRDLALAYSPGVAEACMEIARDPAEAMNLTSRANLVAVITNGTAVLGLGNIGALAGKPVMEGKACLFKKFAGIDVFDIELDENDPDALIDTIARMEPTFGGINLEDIKAPECFYIEKKLRERMKIPVFHDDQHGTAIVAAAAILNALRHVKKDIREVKLVASGAGAAALACLDLIVSLGLPMKNIYVSDSAGVVYTARKEQMDPNKARYAQETSARKLADVIDGADIFLGLSAGGVLKPEMVKEMARDPIILAMANPAPEILPEDALAVRPDAILGTGRSDYPNQVNNVLCFPFIFRGALDVGATAINEEMKLAAVRAIAELAHAEIPEVVAQAYGALGLRFGRDYLIPKPFDPRLIEAVAPAVAQAAVDSGVATRPIADMKAYRQRLSQFVYQSGSSMQPLFAAAKQSPKRVVYAEGEDERVLRAAQVVVDEGLARPLLLGRPEVIADRIAQYGLRLTLGADCEAVDPLDAAVHGDAAEAYYQLKRREGVSRLVAQTEMRSRGTLLAAMLVRQGRADAMLCGTLGSYGDHLRHVRDAIGLRAGASTMAAMQMLMLPGRQLFICDTHVNRDPDAAQIAEIALLAAEEVRRFGVTPSVALLSHSNFGGSDAASAVKMREALALIKAADPQLAVEGEMRGDAALSKTILDHEFPDSALETEANVLVMPNVDAANISYNLLRMAAGSGITVGGILLGAARSVHILTPSSTVRRIVNMTALAVVDANSHRNAA